MTHRFVVMLVLDSDAPALTEDALIEAMETRAGLERMRAAVLASLPGSINRLVAVLSEPQAKGMLALYSSISDALDDVVAEDMPTEH